MYSSKENINILTSLLVEYNISHVVVCPGSRNAPLVHNFNESPYIECHPVTDERSAAFVALGMALKTGEVVAVCVTSGSALLNLLPGVAEASYQHKGILVISADRPQPWIDQLDGQTMPQPDALGKFAACSVSLPECKDDDERWHCRRLICEAMLARQRTGRSVHINVPISEPLFTFTTPTLPEVKAIRLLSWDDEEHQNYLLRMLARAKRPMIILGQMSRYATEDDVIETIRQSIPVLAEPLSVDDPSPALDVVFKTLGEKNAKYKPDFLLYLGRTTISKQLRLFMRTLDKCTVVLNNQEGKIEDPTTHAEYVLMGRPSVILGELSAMLYSRKSAFCKLWDGLLEEVKAKIASEQKLTLEQLAVMELEKYIEKDDDIFYANSTSVRLAARYANHYVYCNRGLNGIEGSLSTAVGASLVSEEKVFCVIGDLSFFYDQNALWNQHLNGNLRILLLNNGGGNIFSTLPGLSDSPARDNLVMAKHNTTAEGVCLEYGIAHKVVTKADELPSAINNLATEHSHRPMLLEVIVEK